MANKLNPFEEQIKKAVYDFETPYDASAWTKLEESLDKSVVPGKSVFRNWFIGASVAVVAIMGMYYFTDNTSENTNVQNETIAEIELPNQELAEKLIEEDQIVTDNSSQVERDYDGDEPSTTKDIEEKSIKKSLKEETTVSVSSNNKPENNLKQENKPVEVILPVVKNEVNSSDTKKIAFEKPIVKVNSKVVCAGADISLTIENDKLEDVNWSFGNGESLNGRNIVTSYSEPGKYEIIATGVESGLESNSIEIIVNPNPDASFTVNEKIENGSIPVVEFKANSVGEKNYQWTINDGTSAVGEKITHTFTKARDYEVSLRVLNKYGCFWTSHQRYTLEKEFNLLAPNTFSPNGDGINDTWYPKALESGYFKFTLTVYDRNNQVVFTTSDPQQEWNGKVNGSGANSGDFFIWKANVVDPYGAQQQFGGTILVIY